MVSDEIELKAKSGVAWRYGAYFASQVLRVVTTTILALKLAPEAFGLVALVNVVIAGFSMVTEAGIGQSIVREIRGADGRFIETAWTLRVIRGFIISAGVALAAFPMARFYESPSLVLLIPFAALNPLIGGFQSPMWDLMAREVREKPRAIVELCRQAVACTVKVAWVLAFPSAWALVGGTLAGTIFFVLVTHALGGWRLPRLAIDGESAASIWKFGKWMIVGAVIAFLGRQADRLAVGRLEAVGVLGVLTIGQTLSRIPLEIAATGTGHVIFPTVSRLLRDADHPRLVECRVLAMRAGMLRIAGAMVLGMFVTLPMFIDYVYPDAYRLAALWGRLALIGVWFQILNSGVNATVLAAGRSGQLAATSIVGVVVGVPLGFLGYGFGGVAGLVVGFAGGAAVSYLRNLWIANSIGIRFWKQDCIISSRVAAAIAIVISLELCSLAILSGRLAASAFDLFLVIIISSYCFSESLRGWRIIGGSG